MMQKDKRINIRNAVSEDIAFCVSLETACFSEPWSQNSFLQSIDADDTYFRIAESNGQKLGYYVAGNICGEVNLYTIAVDPSERKQGIATALLQDLTKKSRTDNAHFIGLEVRESNHSAQRLYEKQQFIQTGKRPSFYRKPTEDALLYTLILKEETI